MVSRSEVPANLVAKVRTICVALPDAHEEPAWVGIRWKIRTRTFAHVLSIDRGWPPAYARAAATHGPVTVLMFRSAGAELLALRNLGYPFFGPPWRNDEVGLVLDQAVDWTEVEELLTDSYCALAPKHLATSVQRPTRG